MNNQIRVSDAIEQALAEEMRRDPRVVIFGDGVATKRRALIAEFGDARVRNTPLAAGVASIGLRPVIDSLYTPFPWLSTARIIDGGMRSRGFGRPGPLPKVVMAMSGSGWNAGAQQNWKLEAWLASSPAMKVLMPSTADDFKGLLKAAIRDDGPVLLLADLALLHSAGPIPDGDYVVPLGKARIRRPGTEVTIVACAKMVRTALTAAEVLARRGVSTEVVDLRSLRPLDEQAILTSVRKTGRLIVLHDANPTGRVGAEVAAVVVERAWSSLRAPIAHITCPDAHPGLEAGSTPQADAIVAAANRMTVEEAALV